MPLAAADQHDPSMLNDDPCISLERPSWNLARDIDFDAVEADKLTPEWIGEVREICAAGLSALHATEPLLRVFHEDVDFCSFVSLWFYEEMKHHLVLRKYLESAGEPVGEVRSPRLRSAGDEGPAIVTLTLHFCGEQRLADRCAALSAAAPEPVLRQILEALAADERRHAAVYAAYLRRAVDGDPAVLPGVLRLAVWAMRTGRGGSRRLAGVAGPSAAPRLEDPHCFRRMRSVYLMLAGDAPGDATGSRDAA
jgi:hypothetical protein